MWRRVLRRYVVPPRRIVEPIRRLDESRVLRVRGLIFGDIERLHVERRPVDLDTAARRHRQKDDAIRITDWRISDYRLGRILPAPNIRAPNNQHEQQDDSF